MNIIVKNNVIIINIINNAAYGPILLNKLLVSSLE